MILDRFRGNSMTKHERDHRSAKRPRRGGLTLIEMLVTMVITLMMIFALAQAFQTISATIAYNRSTVEMASQLRSTSLLLQRDLEGLTVDALPLANPTSNSGYFEYHEGEGKDFLVGDTDTATGDSDDILMFTSRSANVPFSGLFDGGVIESQDAEIVWWASATDHNNDGLIAPDERFIYRRVLLIRPELDGTGALLKNPSDPSLPHWPKTFANSAAGLNQLRGTLADFYNNNDISVRLRWQVLSSGNVELNLTANSLSDLSARENRIAHYPILLELSPTRLVTSADYPTFPLYPYVLDQNSSSVTALGRLRYYGRREGEDVVLQNALAFDVRAFDTFAQVRAHPGEDGGWGVATQDDDLNGTPDNPEEAGWADSDDETVTPGDPGFAAGLQIGTGAFVDLNYNAVFNYVDGMGNPISSSFSGQPHVRSSLSGGNGATWDTWSIHYESDGINQDSGLDSLTDEGVNGFDDDGANGVDDPGERETSPPYNVPLRGIQVRLRMMETDNRLVRQSSVVINFVPE